MTVVAGATIHPSRLGQWWVLTVRLIVPTLRNGEMVTAIVGSAAFTAAFYLPLHQLLGPVIGGMSSYAQFLMPLIAMQAMSFAGASAAFRAATDALLGINRRFGSMPIAALTPLAARMSASFYRCSIGLTAAIVSGHVIGFRFHRGILAAVGFCVLMLTIGMALAYLADVIGTSSRSPEAATQWLLLPQLIFGFLSVGVQPAGLFPEWIQPIVRNQPISQFVYALRSLAGDTSSAVPPVTWSVVGPSIAWLIAMFVAGAVVTRVLLRPR